MRVPSAGFNGLGQQHHIILGKLLRTGKFRPRGKGRRYRESNPPSYLHQGTEAVERIEALEYGSDYEDDGYVLSSAAAVKEEAPTGLSPFWAKLISTWPIFFLLMVACLVFDLTISPE